MGRYKKFTTFAEAVAYLARMGYRQDDAGEWRRDSWQAVLKRLKNGTYRVYTI